MNKSTFFDLVKKPELLNEESLPELMAIVNEYPWFQAGRILLVKNLHVLDHVRYNSELKVAAANIPDRGRLFDLIQNAIPGGVVKEEQTPHVIESQSVSVFEAAVEQEDLKEAVPSVPSEPENSNSATSSVSSGGDYFQVDDVYDTLDGRQINFSLAEQKGPQAEQLDDIVLPSADFLEYDSTEMVVYQLGKVVDINKVKDENRSFSAWLNLLKQAPIAKAEDEPATVKKSRQLIDSFLSTSAPRIVPNKAGEGDKNSSGHIELKARQAIHESEDLMSETLAGIYIKQKHYQKAIVIFEKLCLKYPEKNVYFAQRISDLEKLINNQ